MAQAFRLQTLSLLNPKMAKSAAEAFGAHGAGEGADVPPEEEAVETTTNRSSNASDGAVEDSQVPPDEDDEDEDEEDEPASTQVYKRPAAKKKPQMSMSDVMQGMGASSSKLADDIVSLKKRKAELRKERQEQAKMLKNASRQVSRLKNKAHLLSNNDLMEVFLFRKELEEKKKEAAAASSSTAPALKDAWRRQKRNAWQMKAHIIFSCDDLRIIAS